jgi:hypothetical protein
MMTENKKKVLVFVSVFEEGAEALACPITSSISCRF